MSNYQELVSARAALEQTYLNIVINDERFKYVDDAINDAITDCKTSVTLKLKDILQLSESDSIDEESIRFINYMRKIYTGLGYLTYINEHSFKLDWLK